MKSIVSFLIITLFCADAFSQSRYSIYPRVDIYDLHPNLSAIRIDSIKEMEFHTILDRSGMRYKKLRGFHHDSLGFINWVDCKEGEAVNDYFLSMLANRDSSVLIGICIWETKNGLIRENVQIKPDADPEENWKVKLEYNVDTVAQPVLYYLSNYLKVKYHADIGGEYKLRCTLPYNGEYTSYKVVFLHKCYQANAEIYYFSSNRTAEEMENIIKETAGMLFYDGQKRN